MAPTKPVFAVLHETRLAHPSSTNAAGVPADKIQLCKQCRSVHVVVNTSWITTPIDDRWTVAYRLVPQDGQPVVAEVRVYPTEPNQQAREWSGVLRGTDAKVPRGGLTARRFRTITLGGHLAQGTEAMGWAAREIERQRIALRRAGKEVAPGVFEPDGVLGSFGFQRPSRETPTRRRGPGRPGRSPKECVRIASLYAAACARSSRRPVVDVAKRLNRDTFQVRDILQRARALNLLTRPLKGGAAGGILTDEARALLAAARRPKTRKAKKTRKGARQ